MENCSTRSLSYQDVHNLTHDIILQLKKDNFIPDIVAGFCRGGMLPSVILSQYFDCRFIPIELSLRDNRVATPEYQTSQRIDDAIRFGWNVLIIDDICDSGKTFLTFHEMQAIINPQDKNIQHLKTAALQRRYTSSYVPNYIAEFLDNDDWQIYPWEVK